MKKGTNEVVDDRKSIIEILGSKSPSIRNLLETNDDHFILYYKDITHSDLISCGKRTKSSQPFSKNLLYYLTEREMEAIEENSDKPFETAHQSCIGLRKDFYISLGVPNPREKEVYKFQDKGVRVFLVNDTVKYFTFQYTKQVIDLLGKTNSLKWDNSPMKLEPGEFSEIEVSVAVHGLGVKENVDFQNLRKSIFINDRIYFLIRDAASKELYILLEKNPKFYQITKLANDSWVRYLDIQRLREKEKTNFKNVPLLAAEDEKTRVMQARWKDMLVREMRNYTTHEGEVFCPFTGITANFEDVPMLFIASHIKRYTDSSSVEAFDINNGLLLSANADALFDKHMITVTENKELKFSFLLDSDIKLKNELLLSRPLFSAILNEERMVYMAEHRRIFEEKELERKHGVKSNSTMLENSFLYAAESAGEYK